MDRGKGGGVDWIPQTSFVCNIYICTFTSTNSLSNHSHVPLNHMKEFMIVLQIGE